MEKDRRRADIRRRAGESFQEDALAAPRMSLRGGYAEDSYETPPPFDPLLDEPTDGYLEAYTFWGLGYLDAASWRHYLPRLIDYAHRHPDDPEMVVEGLIHNLRPPDRDPPRLASLTMEQEEAVAAFLEDIAFSEDCANGDLAMQALEEWWLPDALYRKRRDEGP